MNTLEYTREGISPVKCVIFKLLSKVEHVKFYLKMGGPPSKPKYSLSTDSEQVPWGKGEKNPYEGSETDLKPNAYKQ